MAETKTKAESQPGVFETLNAINVNNHKEQKNGLSYLSWAWAWAEVKKVYPDANYEIEKFDGLPYVASELGIMCYVKVTIQGQTHEMWLPVMDGANKAMKFQPYTYTAWEWKDGKKVTVQRTVAAATMFDVNKTIMRCLVKALGMFGLGLYIYAGEDLPEDDKKSIDRQMSAGSIDKKEFSKYGTPSAWAFAIAKVKAGELKRENIEKRYIVLDSTWSTFMAEVNAQ